MKLINWIKSLFSAPSYQDRLEAFVVSKHPSTVTEVEHWIEYYDIHYKEWVV